MVPGKYIVIEGHDGIGKTTQVDRLVSNLNKHNFEAIEIAEPGGTDIGYDIRQIIKNGELERDAITNLLLFTADRREMWNQKALPALRIGKFVVSARNWYSTLAYQGYGEGLDIDLIKETTMNYVGKNYSSPDLSILLSNNDQKERLGRIENRGSESDNNDTFESRPDDFQNAVSLGYQTAVKELCNYEIDVSGKTRDEVEKLIWSIVEKYLPKYKEA